MYPENNNQNNTWKIVVGVIGALIFTGLFIGCIAVVMQFVKLEENGKLDVWLAENESEDDYDSDDGFGYYDDDGDFHYYDDTTDEDDWDEGIWEEDEEDGYKEPTHDKDDYAHSTHDEDIEGYETGEYFSFPADNRVDDLDYSVEIEEDLYEDGTGTGIYYSYAVVKGDAPNIDDINDIIMEDIDGLIEFYEEEYKPYMSENDLGIYADLSCNVTYMTEDILSIVYQESIYYDEAAGYATDYYLYCLNFDMQNGTLLDKTEMLDIDEEFVEEFRERSREQNADSVLDYYDDYELLELFGEKSNLILFYCEQGMEIGLNVQEGWVTVTYPDYEKYLKSL